MKFLWTSKFVFPYNVLKSTIKLHSLRPIRSLKFLHLKFLTIIFKTMIREFVGDISVMFKKKISKNNSNSTEIYVVIQRKEWESFYFRYIFLPTYLPVSLQLYFLKVNFSWNGSMLHALFISNTEIGKQTSKS